MKDIPSSQKAQETRLGEIYGDTQTITRIFYLFIALALVGLIGGIFIVLTTNDTVSAAILAIGTLPVLVARYQVRIKRFESAAAFLAVLFILMNTALSTKGLGIHNISNFAYPVILIIASLITGKRTMFFLTFLTILCIAWLVFGELWGLYTPGILVRSVTGDFLSASLIVVLTAILVRQLTGIIFQSISRAQDEVVERRYAEENLHQREAILEAVTFAAEQFLKTPDWRENIDNVLERLGRTINATHAYLFEDHLNARHEPVTSMRYEWTAPGYPSDLDVPYYQNSLIHQEGYEEQVERLKRGEVRLGTSSTFNPIEKLAMQDIGVKSILEVPIFVKGREWGAIGFDDLENEREWSPAEVDALKIAAGILSAAIQRQEAEAAVQESERIYRQAIQAAGMVPYYRDYVNHRYAFIGEGIKEITGYSADELTPQIWEQMEVKGFPRGSMAHLTYEEADRLTEQGLLQHWECDYLIVNRHGQERWVSDSCIQVRNDRNIRIGVVGIVQDITDRKLIEASLRQREAILEAVAASAEGLLATSEWRMEINGVLERLGKSIHASHAYLFEHHVGVDGVEYSSLKYEWTAPGYPSDFENPHYKEPHPLNWETDSTDHLLRQGNIFLGNLSTMSVVDRERLAGFGVKAMAELPVFLGGRWWGTIGFDDFDTEREWSITEVDALKIAVGILSAAIQRQMDEEALKFSEQKFSKVFRSSPDSVTLSELENGRLIEVNDGFQKVFGYNREEAIGRTTVDLGLYANPADRDKMVQMLHEQGSVRNLEMTGRHKNGSELAALLSVERIEIAGRPHLVTITRDITERNRMEKDLRKSEALYRALFEQSHDAVFILDMNARHIAANQRAAEMLGYTLDEIQKLSMRDLSAETSESEKIMEQMMTGRHIPTYERLFRKKNGEIFPVEVNVELVRDDTGNPLHIQSIVRDVTQRKQAEERLWQFKNTLDQTHDCVFMFTQDTLKFFYVNQGAVNQVGYTEQELYQLHPYDIKPEYPEPKFCVLLQPLIEGALPSLRFETVHRHKDGHLVPVEIFLQYITLDGEKERFVAIVHDITERKRAEAEREKFITELSTKNAELEQFTYTVSHDLKSPLVTINGFLGYLEQDAASGNLERLKKDTQRISEAVQKMQRLLSELLELSRIGRMMNAPETIPFNELVNEALDIVHGQLEERRITVHTYSNLPPVYGDRPRLVEVLQNLIDNAAKYMGEQPEPLIEIGRRREENGLPVFFVRDNGMGIAPEHHERIFGLFNKLDPRSEGTGVGLALVKRIIEFHGGRIWIESEVGQGTTFYFSLPSGNAGIKEVNL